MKVVVNGRPFNVAVVHLTSDVYGDPTQYVNTVFLFDGDGDGDGDGDDGDGDGDGGDGDGDGEW